MRDLSTGKVRFGSQLPSARANRKPLQVIPLSAHARNTHLRATAKQYDTFLQIQRLRRVDINDMSILRWSSLAVYLAGIVPAIAQNAAQETPKLEFMLEELVTPGPAIDRKSTRLNSSHANI